MVTEVNSHDDRRPFTTLFPLARSGTSEALGELLESYRNYLRVLAAAQVSRRLSLRMSPSDIVQETMLAAHRDFAEFRGESAGQFSAWLRTILARSLFRTVERHLKAEKRDLRKEISLQSVASQIESSCCAISNILQAATLTASSIVMREEELVRIYDLLAKLPNDYRDVIVMRNLNSMRFEAIAQQMGRSSTAARLLWLRAIRRLRALNDQSEIP